MHGFLIRGRLVRRPTRARTPKWIFYHKAFIIVLVVLRSRVRESALHRPETDTCTACADDVRGRNTMFLVFFPGLRPKFFCDIDQLLFFFEFCNRFRAMLSHVLYSRQTDTVQSCKTSQGLWRPDNVLHVRGRQNFFGAFSISFWRLFAFFRLRRYFPYQTSDVGACASRRRRQTKGNNTTNFI